MVEGEDAGYYNKSITLIYLEKNEGKNYVSLKHWWKKNNNESKGFCFT